MMNNNNNTNTNRRRQSKSSLTTTAALLSSIVSSSLSVAAAARDPDCQPPSSPNLYTGYSLKVGTDCAQYVYCRDGQITSWHTCPGGLLFNGGVGEEGICDWERGVECRDTALDLAFGELVLGGQALIEDVDVDVTNANEVPAPVPASMNYNSNNDNTSVNVVQQAAQAAAAAQGGGEQVVNQSANMMMMDETLTEPIEIDNPNNYYCGMSVTDASQSCIPCPSGYVNECPAGNGCFVGITQCNINPTAPNPNNYYCGTSVEDAAANCIPCPSGYVSDCGDNPNHGCFIGVETCSATAQQQQQQQQQTTMSNPQQTMTMTITGNNDNYYDATNQNQAANNMATAAVDTPPPTLSPSLPPWTNAPFVPSSQLNPSKTVIGYYASWQWYDRDKLADPQNIDFTKYDRINYAFFQPDTNGRLYGTDEWADPQLLWGPYIYNEALQNDNNYFCSWDGPNVRNCNYHDTTKGLLYLAQSKGVEVMPSIGGWTLSDNFPGIAGSASKRALFAQQCVDLIKAYGFDGIDIDWEYPGYKDHSGTPADKENYTLLLAAIRGKLNELQQQTGRFYGLTAALPCGPDKIDDIQIAQIRGILTELNLMTYDMHGAWDALTGTNAPIFDQGWGDKTKRWSVHGCVNNYVEQGVHLSQINIGLPFYGRSMRDATGMKQFHGGADDINFHLDEGSPQYFNIVNELGRMQTYRHEKTQTQYAVFNNGGGMVSYDDEQAICDKVHYANERGLHGFLIWEISGDMVQRNGRTETPLIDATNRKIKNPNFNCASYRDPSSLDAPDEPDYVDWSLYEAPLSAGSGSDFNGAQEPRPAPTGAGRANAPSNNMVWIASDSQTMDESDDDCPLDYTGYYPTTGCTRYVQCQSGSVIGGSQPCVPGTLFDVTIGVCNWAAQVPNCG